MRVLTVGGLDPNGGAGITADVMTITHTGARAAAVPSCLTVQSRHGLRRVEPVDPGLLREMLDAVFEHDDVGVVKTGLFGDPGAIGVVAEVVRARGLGLVVDPVLSATAGGWAAADELAAALVERLIPLATVVTPNLPELEALAAGDPRRLIAAGARAVLVKGGHAVDDRVVDRLIEPHATTEFEHARIDRGEVHGTGCALAAALAAHLASDHRVQVACERAIASVRARLEVTSPGPDAPADLGC